MALDQASGRVSSIVTGSVSCGDAPEDPVNVASFAASGYSGRLAAVVTDAMLPRTTGPPEARCAAIR